MIGSVMWLASARPVFATAARAVWPKASRGLEMTCKALLLHGLELPTTPDRIDVRCGLGSSDREQGFITGKLPWVPVHAAACFWGRVLK